MEWKNANVCEKGCNWPLPLLFYHGDFLHKPSIHHLLFKKKAYEHLVHHLSVSKNVGWSCMRMEISSWWTCRHTCFIHLLQFFNWTTICSLLRWSEPILFKKVAITILCCCLHNNQSHCSGPSLPLQWLAVSHTAASLPSCTTQQSWCPRFIKKGSSGMK